MVAKGLVISQRLPVHEATLTQLDIHAEEYCFLHTLMLGLFIILKKEKTPSSQADFLVIEQMCRGFWQ